MPVLETTFLVALGLAAGVVSGLLGVGGGIVMVPALLLVLDTPFHVAKAASLLVIAVAAGVGVATHHGRGAVAPRLGLVLGATGIVGSIAAVHAAERLADASLRLLFGLFLILVSLQMMRGEPARAEDGHHRGLRFLLAVPVGLAAGFVAGLFGVGGGILMVPAMAVSGIPMHTAVGTSLVAVTVNGLAATFEHLRLGYFDAIVGLGLALAVGQIPGVRLGAVLAHRLPAERLRRVFAVFLFVVGAYLAWQGFGQT
ncbi:MAG: sulfite exporter TauE/SafE family protein [Methanobacteriota archaeon]